MFSKNANLWLMFVTVIFVLLCRVAHAQPDADFAFTITVDPNAGEANHQTIQGAINDSRIGNNPTDRWTILINAGTYNEAVTLDDVQENIDLVGVDRDGVIINVATTATPGIVITSGTETVRNNSIRNLTIVTADGHGIEIDKGSGPSDKAPKNIAIEGVTIQAGVTATTAYNGISATDVDGLSVADCLITTEDGGGVILIKDEHTPQNISIERVSIVADGPLSGLGIRANSADNVLIKDCKVTTDDQAGILVGDHTTIEASSIASGGPGVITEATSIEGLRIIGSTIVATGTPGVHIGTPNEDTLVRDTTIQSTGIAFHMERVTEPFRIVNCTLAAEADNDSAIIYALRHDTVIAGQPVVVAERSRLVARNSGSGGASAIFLDPGGVRLVDCEVITETETGPAVGLRGDGAYHLPFEFIGCTFTTSSADERETEVFDLTDPDTTVQNVVIARCSLSKWRARLKPASGAKTAVERVLGVTEADDDAILPQVTLASNEKTYDATTIPAVQDPDVYRVLVAKRTGNIGADLDVFVIGTNWAGDSITERFTFTSGGSSIVSGKKPFRTVEKVIGPPSQLGQGTQTIQIGTTNWLGLTAPIADATDVIQYSKEVSSVYETQPPVPLTDIDLEYATIKPAGTFASTSFEFVYLTPN